MHRFSFSTGLCFLIAAAMCLVAACAKTYDHKQATAQVAPEKITQRTKWSAQVKDTGQVRDGWLKNFHDPVLDQLVDEAMRQNPNLQAAASRVEQAEAMTAQARASLKPTVGLGTQLSRTTRSDWSPRPEGLGVGVSWEADVWGRMRLGVRASEESAEAIKADYEFARQSLAAAVAKAWFLVCETQMQVNFLGEVVKLLEHMSAIVKQKEQIGKVSMQDVHQIRAQLASAKAVAAKAETARQEAARSLEVLLGRYPEASIKSVNKLDTNLPPIPVGMPSSMLSRRPDLIAAQDRVAAAFYAEKGSKLLHLPRFVIQGAGGVSGLGQAIAGLAAGIFAPLYTGGKIEAQMAQATAAQKEAVSAYGAAALNAFKDVENALANEKLLAQREKYLNEAGEEDRKTYDLSKIQYDVGKVDMFEVLQLQSRWIGAEITLLDTRRLVLDNRVNLHLALGGSFETTGDQ